MTLAFLRLPPDERRLFIDEAAARRGLSPIIIEKDFWVCWLLGVLFESAFRDAIVFKGVPRFRRYSASSIGSPKTLISPSLPRSSASTSRMMPSL
jgi:hypothetical protein